MGTLGSKVALPGPGRFLPLFLLFRGGILGAALFSSEGSSGAKEWLGSSGGAIHVDCGATGVGWLASWAKYTLRMGSAGRLSKGP